MGQKHIRRTFTVLPEQRRHRNDGAFIGIIGSGNYAFTTIAYYLRKKFGNVITGVMDIDINKARATRQPHTKSNENAGNEVSRADSENRTPRSDGT